MVVDDLLSSEMQGAVCNWKWRIKEKFILIPVLYIFAIYTELDISSEICSDPVKFLEDLTSLKSTGFLAL